MATVANDTGFHGGDGFAAWVDRWIYVFMAGLLLCTVLIGFLPDSIRMLDAVATGKRPPLPPILHVHAVLMGSWLMLLLAQTLLMATGRPAPHKQLGMIGMILAPALVIAGFLLVPAMHDQRFEMLRHATPETAAAFWPIQNFTLDITLIQIRVGIMFGVLVAIAFAVRKSDCMTHKRLMILAISAAIPAATDRMGWLHTTMPASPLTADIYPLILLAPMILWDLYRLRTIQRAYWIWLGVALIPTIAVYSLWGTDWWHKTALTLLGASDLI